MRFTKSGRRVPDGVQLTARERPNGNGVDIAAFSAAPPPDRRREFPPVERVEALEVARDVSALLGLRDVVREDMSSGTMTAADARIGGQLLGRIEQALVRLAGGGEAVTFRRPARRP